MRIWVESSGGPLALVPAEALHEWTGVNGADYDAACAVDGFGVIGFGKDRSALILWDEPARTTFFERLFVQWMYADSDGDVERAVSRLCDVVWEQGPIVDVGGLMVLLDAAAPGPEVRIDQARGEMDAEAINVEIEPGFYRVDRGEVSPDERTRVRCYRLVAVT
ncbi:Imm21 family immunity protein [Nonomuraea sp. NPDC049421]|uniref:Imm21 family immunity protein n=1 Tax=Nonomuraea sp. NPDC049421 TaxID=3155275 RepID=UPI00343A4828